MKRKQKIFISAVSSELGYYRLAVDQALRKCDYETVHQEIFPQTSGKIRELLRDSLSGCDAVICLVGNRYGFEDADRTEGEPRYSYTQLEYIIARELEIETFLFLTDPEQPPPRYRVVSDIPAERNDLVQEEPKELQQLQQTFRDLAVRDRDWRTFRDENHLLYQLTTLRFHWQKDMLASAADSQVNAFTTEDKRASLADVFAISDEQLEGELPDYASSYLNNDAETAERLALANAHQSEQSNPSAKHEIAAAYWIAGLSAKLRGRDQDALEHLSQSLEKVDPDQDAGLRVRIRSAIGYVLLSKGDFNLARAELHEVVADAEAEFGSEHRVTLLAQGNLAVALTSLGDAASAEPLVRHILSVRRRVLGSEHPRTLGVRNTLANCLTLQGKLEQAEAEYFELRDVYASVLGGEHPQTLRQHFNLANNLAEQAAYDEAEREYRHLLRLCEKVHGSEHPETASVLNDLAWLYYHDLKDHAQAKGYADRAVKILSRRGRRHPETLSARHTLASIRATAGQWQQAQTDFHALIRDQAKVFGDSHAQTLTSRYDLAKMLSDHKVEPDEASRQIHEALKQATENLGGEHTITMKCRELLTRIKDPTR